ncbi:ATP synthase F1 subunit gamma [Fimbriimonas ginsengisoli]|uniref:ATP synthase gamma chain n=1 Tax=Fimbriimonas ginsengisoli Gsoil 348 TaxID=661478 RepID=A0A068NZ82_FIMGI|nr:ATP synthase F1 subunit gamma [Fimbriimonas ginsengisoli]AIE88119.1 ATP synthase gamma chain [Fimbriimonas ginsengisoli Gsoil 348]
MATLKEIRARIKAAKNIQQITKAMKLVAAARLKKATDRVLEARPYADKLREVMRSLSSAGDLPQHPLMTKRPVQKAVLILLTSDRGLAGGFNTSLTRKASEFIRDAGFDVSLLTVGKKGTLFFGRRGYKILHTVTVPSSGARLEDAIEVTKKARELFESGEADAIYVCYSKFYSAIRQVPQIVQLLPIEAPASEGDASGGLAYQFEPDPATLLNTLLPRYFQTLVWQSMLESTASEFGARMTAMTSATDNAGKMIQNLTLKANRERQAAITKEILEVVGGAEALNG